MRSPVPPSDADPILSGRSLAAFPGAAAIVDSAGGVTLLGDVCEIAGPVLGDGEAHRQLIDAARAAAGATEAAQQLVQVAALGAAVEITVLPLAEREDSLVLLRSVEFEQVLRARLIESRERYKEFLALSDDFAWETDAEGRFVFVASESVLGWAAEDLVGQRAAELLPDERDEASVFTTRSPVRNVELWLRRADGGVDCMIIAAAPLQGRDGAWCGARGVCRVVTDQRAREAEEARVRLRERLTVHLARLVRDEIDPKEVLRSTASMIDVAISSTGGFILRRSEEGWQLVANWGAAAALSSLLARFRDGAGHGIAEWVEGGHQALGFDTRFGGVLNGVLAILRPAGHEGFGSEDRLILGLAAEQLGPVIAQLGQQEQSARLARTDPLTGLLNRRALLEEATRRLVRLQRTERSAAVVYIDLDNFKLVNDRRGHQAGDAALVKVADIIREYSRSEDMAARIGGDEFVLWLDGAEQAVAEKRARRLLDAAQKLLAPLTEDPERPLGLSLGIAVFSPARPESAESIIARADRALYVAKRDGKGRFAFAEQVAHQ